jgi:glutathione synthase/RimK-type ligase-like ATP-grasp enzyme
MSELHYVTDAPGVAPAGCAQRPISACEYIEGLGRGDLAPGTRLVNACGDLSYLSVGYYVGLLAQARGHHIISEPHRISGGRLPSRLASRIQFGARTSRRIGILHTPDEPFSPSSREALELFAKSAAEYDLDTVLMSKEQISELPSADALFIRDYTTPTNASFCFSARAEGSGMPVIDDPSSILRCANKIFINELCVRHGVSTPKTLVVMPTMDFDSVARYLGVPFVLKLPDSAFSIGVHKVDNRREGNRLMNRLRKKSAILCAQEFMPTEFDWRVATLDGEAIFVCKYFMAEGHWQIARHHAEGYTEGHGCAVALRDAPPKLLRFAEQVSSLVGNGLYGLDIKEYRGAYRLIEVNDNPNIDDLEASIPEDNVWAEIASFFATKLRAKREIPDYAHTIVGHAAAYDLRENTGNLIRAKDALVASAS